MGNSPSQPEASSRPDGFTQLNNSVWELYRPEGVPKVEVIFFHGLQLSDYREAFWKTWRSRDNSVVWPAAWLGPSLGNARISSVSYDSSARQGTCDGSADVYQIIENLMQDVVLCLNFRIDRNSEVILVGHSVGGLIIKQLLLQCMDVRDRLDPREPSEASKKERIETFLSKCRGIFYYSTPQGDSELAAYADRANHVPGANFNMPIMNFLKVFSKETARINSDFIGRGKPNRSKNLTHMLKIATEAIVELCDTEFAGLSRRVVPEASARYNVDSYYCVNANHFEVCKAENNKFSGIFTVLRDFCKNCTTEASLELHN